MRISTHPENSTICPGETATFNSEARGNITTDVSGNVAWKRFETQSGEYDNLTVESKYIYFMTINSKRTSLAAALTIKSITPDDEGWYVFEVGSYVMSNRAYLTVAGTLYNVSPKLITVV